MKILFISLGCDKNLVDSERMLGLLEQEHFTMTDSETEADVIVVNTCCFIGDAKEESIQNILEMAEAYSVFANNGKSVERKFITQITDDRGFLVYSDKPTEGEQILDPTKTYVMNEMMTGMFNMQQNNHLSVTGLSIIPNLTHQYAGKSGSTNTDSWMIGYTPDLVTTVWTGYDQGRTLDGVEVNRYAKNIWSQVMENSLKESGSQWFETPKDVVAVKVDPTTGYLASENCQKKVTLYYETTNVPSTACIGHHHESALVDHEELSND